MVAASEELHASNDATLVALVALVGNEAVYIFELTPERAKQAGLPARHMRRMRVPAAAWLDGRTAAVLLLPPPLLRPSFSLPVG